MAKQRVATRGLSKRRTYRKRVKKSPCRKKGPAVCRTMKKCKYTKGKKRTYCRKVSNRKL
jgi:hypothetical protein